MSRQRLCAALAAGLLFALAACSPDTAPPPATASRTFAQLEPPIIIAHRGAGSQFPENTLYAMDRAARYPRIVLDADVRITRDGTLVLSHDATLDRLSAPLRGPIDGYTAATWKTVPVSWPPGAPRQPPVHASTWQDLADTWGGKRVLW